MSRSNEFKEQGVACRCSATDSQFGDLAVSVPSPVELVSLVFACPLPKCEIERNAGSCRADPTRSARWPARVNLAAFWQQIAPIVPFLPTLPTAKYCTVCYLQIAAHLDTEEVAGSNPVVPTIIINGLAVPRSTRIHPPTQGSLFGSCIDVEGLQQLRLCR